MPLDGVVVIWHRCARLALLPPKEQVIGLSNTTMPALGFLCHISPPPDPGWEAIWPILPPIPLMLKSRVAAGGWWSQVSSGGLVGGGPTRLQGSVMACSSTHRGTSWGVALVETRLGDWFLPDNDDHPSPPLPPSRAWVAEDRWTTPCCVRGDSVSGPHRARISWDQLHGTGAGRDESVSLPPTAPILAKPAPWCKYWWGQWVHSQQPWCWKALACWTVIWSTLPLPLTCSSTTPQQGVVAGVILQVLLYSWCWPHIWHQLVLCSPAGSKPAPHDTGKVVERTTQEKKIS